jgi:cephalosporin-C deacetylase
LAIKPSLPAPADFDSYWAGEKAKLAAVPLHVQLTPVKSAVPGVVCFDLQADSVHSHLSGYLAYPVDAKPHSLPAMFLPHGAGVMSSWVGVAAQWAKEGFLALDFNVQGLPNGQPPEFYANLAQTSLKLYQWQGRENRDTFFFHDAFLRVIRAIDVLTAQPQWDVKIVIANGRSQGGGQAIAGAGLDSRVTFLCAEIPALCDHTGVVIGRANGWPRLAGYAKALTPGEKPPYDDRIVQASRYYDAVNFAARTKAPAFFTVGFIDGLCPPTTVYAAYNQLSGKKTNLNLPTHGHQKTPEGDAGVRQAIADYMKSQKPESSQ